MNFTRFFILCPIAFALFLHSAQCRGINEHTLVDGSSSFESVGETIGCEDQIALNICDDNLDSQSDEALSDGQELMYDDVIHGGQYASPAESEASSVAMVKHTQADGLPVKQVLDQYNDIIEKVGCFVKKGSSASMEISLFQFGDEEISNILSQLSEGAKPIEIFEQLDLSDGLRGVEDPEKLISSFEISAEILSALCAGVSSEQILKQFEIASDDGMSSILGPDSISYAVDQYALIVNLLRGLPRNNSSILAWGGSCLTRFCDFLSPSRKVRREFFRIAYAVCSRLSDEELFGKEYTNKLFDDLLYDISESGVKDVCNIISSAGFADNTLGTSSAILISLIFTIHDVLHWGIDPKLICTALNKEFRFHEKGKLTISNVNSFYNWACLKYIYSITDPYVNKHKNLLALSESITHQGIRHYLDSLLRVGLSKPSDSIDHPCELSRSPRVATTIYRKLCSVLVQAMGKVNQDDVWNAISKEAASDNPDIIALTGKTVKKMQRLIGSLQDKEQVQKKKQTSEAVSSEVED